MSVATHRRPRLLAILAGILVIALTLQACSSNANPSSFIKDTYERDTSLDEKNADAYVAADSPEAVATEISSEAQPLDRRTSSENASTDGGNSVFLQYQDVIVAIFPHDGNGSRIMLGSYRTMHSAYFLYVGGFWASTPGGAGGGSNNRGGGAGSGK